MNPHQPGITGNPHHSVHRRIAESDIKQSIHHTGHRHRRAGSYGNKERFACVAQTQLSDGLEPAHLLFQQAEQTFLGAFGLPVPAAAEVSSQHKGGRHRKAYAHHPRQIECLHSHLIHVAVCSARLVGSDLENAVMFHTGPMILPSI